jgi:hypothetical protein
VGGRWWRLVQRAGDHRKRDGLPRIRPASGRVGGPGALVFTSALEGVCAVEVGEGALAFWEGPAKPDK